MKTFSNPLWRGVASFGVLVVSLLAFALPVRAAVDEAINRGVWKLVYKVTDAQVNSAAWLAADADGDGLTNQAELNAATDPFKPSSGLRVTALTANATTVSLTFQTLAKKSYSVEATPALVPSNWAPVVPAVQVIGDGSDKTLVVPRSAGGFFRVLVQDLDSDDDSVSDWAENVVGLNPGVASSNGQVDHNGLPISDRAHAAAQLAAHGTVTISAIASLAMRPATALQAPPSIGKFKLTRGGFAQFLPAAVVNQDLGGTATQGADYEPLPLNISFAEGEVSKEIDVTPLHNPNRLESVSVVATLQGAPSYTIDGQGWAAVIINPTNAPSGTGLLARYWDTSSSIYIDAANFGQAGTYNFTRSVSPTTTGTIVVSYGTGNLSALQVGHSVKLSFTSGNLNNALYNHQPYPVTAVTASSFTIGITAAAALPASGTGNCSFNIQTFPHPPAVERLDPTVNFDWQYGTPNGVVILPNNSPEN